jgi:hypothetical protein
VFESHTPEQIGRYIRNPVLHEAVWAHTSRSTVGFVRVNDHTSLGSGTLIRFGNTVGIVTCAHVRQALLDEIEVGILCFQVRARQPQRQRLNMGMIDSIAIGAPPWGESGPDLAFLRLPTPGLDNITSVATIVNGDLHRQNFAAGEPEGTRKLHFMQGVIAVETKPSVISHTPNGHIATTAFQTVLNVGKVFVDDENTDRFRFQPVSSGNILPESYQGTSGAGLWRYYLAGEHFSLVQARLIGVAYWEKPIDRELHVIGHGPVSIYETLFNAICQKWP